MNAIRNDDYFVGLDMGTGSLGAAVTDSQYNLLKIKGKDFWFVREYETADTQINRRTNRISKRRLKRHKARIGLIRSYFAEDVLSHDPLFYIRQDNSKYYYEDKDLRLTTKDIFFAEPYYGDKEYYAEYPTIFHLRQALLNDEIVNEERYSRFLYLAIINMFEHRGHFLLNVEGGDINTDLVEDAGNFLMKYIYDIMKREPEDISYRDVISILSDKNISRSTKKDEIISLLTIKKSEKKLVELIKCLCGLDSDARIIFGIDAEEKIKLNFAQVSFEAEKDQIEASIGDEYFLIVEYMKQLYDYSQLQSVLKGFEYLSDARVALYNKHNEDLHLLKDVYRKYLNQEKYDIMFRSNKEGTYSAYCNSLNSNNSLAEAKKYRRNMKDRDKSKLYDRIKKDFKGIENIETEKILKDIEIEQFLPKQITGENGVIPNQVHKKELQKILEHAEKHLTFLSEIDESGYSVSERILKLFSSNLPYYIGPVGNGSKTGWATIKEPGQVLPWNLEQKIDVEKTSEEFIKRLIRDCTYISGEKVLPKQSLLYEKFCVLNEINNLQINGKRIVPELKQDIFNELFIGTRLGKKVTKKNLCAYLINRGIINDESEVSGIDKNVNAYLPSYGKMYAIFGERLKEEFIRDTAEKIIYYGTIYGDSKVMFRKKLEEYISKNIITEQDTKRILGYKFKDWARLSENLLRLTGCDKSTGEIISIIQAMWDYNMNFMELIHSEDFTFKESLDEKRQVMVKPLKEFQYDDLDEYYYSAPVKRMIWQAVLALKEITHIMGHNPKRVFIEMTRSDEEKGEKGRKSSRANKLLKLYESIEDDRDWKSEINKANESGSLNSKKLYLYYLQMGIDAYTGEEIDISDLFDSNRYDIDHIYPRSLTNDNNIENNLVLASKQINQFEKKNDYPVPLKVRKNPKVRELWDRLHKMNFMNDEKYKRLVSNERLTDEQLSGFIARQLVETAQGTKGIAELIRTMIPDTKIVYAKAKNVADFRKEFDLYKCRLVNDFHHAKDAYLNIVVGNVYFTKFTQNPMNFIKKDVRKNGKEYGYNLYKMFAQDVTRNGEVAWTVNKNGEPGTIKLVKQTMEKNTPIITRHTFEQKGELFNIQPIGKYSAKKENYVPLKVTDPKLTDVEKYGGYTSLKPAYFIFIEHGPEKKRKKCFEVVQSYYASQIKNDENLEKLLVKKGYENPRIICNKIKKNSLIKLNGYFLYIIGMDSRKQVEFSNATPMCLKSKYTNYVYKLDKFNREIRGGNKRIDEKRFLDVTPENNLELYKELTYKHSKAIYKKHPKSIGSFLENGEAKFKNLSVEEQVTILCNIVFYTSFEKGTFSLKDIGGPKEVGRIRFSGNMTDAEELKLVNYSVTGFYRNEIDLLNK